MRTQLVDGLLTDLLQVEIFMCEKLKFGVKTHNLTSLDGKVTWSNNCANEPCEVEKETINKTISLDLFLSISVQLDQTRKSQTLTAFG